MISEALMEHGSIRYEGYIMHPALEDGEDISEWRGAYIPFTKHAQFHFGEAGGTLQQGLWWA